MKFAILLPMRGTVSGLSVSSFLGMAACSQQWAQTHGHEVEVCTVVRGHTLLARNTLANLAVREVKADYVLWLDDDAVVPPDILPKLYAKKEETKALGVAAKCFQRGSCQSPAGYWEGNTFQHTTDSRWIDSTGLHCVLHSTIYFQAARRRLPEGVYFQTGLDKEANLSGEDRFFWSVVRDQLKDLRLWHAGDIEAGHVFEGVLTEALIPNLKGKVE